MKFAYQSKTEPHVFLDLKYSISLSKVNESVDWQIIELCVCECVCVQVLCDMVQGFTEHC